MHSLLTLSFPALAVAHIAAFGPGMYCRDGLPGQNNQNNNLPVGPLYELSKQDFWFQHDRGCDAAPPAAGDFLELPVGGNFTVEHANNQAFTTLSYEGKNVSPWPDGAQHPDNWHGEWQDDECMPGGGWLHTTNQSDAQGTAFAIAYKSNLTDISMEDLVVFSVLQHTPWKRLATYQVPAGMPECPPGGCTCAHLWVPRGCGQPNMYMQGFRCKTTGATGNRQLAKAQPPVWCASDASKCVKGAKQMIVFNQAEGNNVPAPDGDTPAYNSVVGFHPGAQEDIFAAESATSTLPAKVTHPLTTHKASSIPTRPTTLLTKVSTKPPKATTAPSPSSTPLSYDIVTETVYVTVTA